MPQSLSMPETTAEGPPADLRLRGPAPQFETKPDLVHRLRMMDNRTPFAKGIILEAAAEIERLRDAIRKHRGEVWGADEPDHASDAKLYRVIE